MAQAVSYGSITIVDTTDIEEIYMIYAGSDSSDSMPTFTYAAVTGGTIWKRDASQITGDYIWQSTVVTKSGVEITSSNWTNFYGVPVCITGPDGLAAKEISTIETQYCNYGDGTPGSSANWQSSTPAYDATKPNYWTRTRLKYDDNTYSSWTAPVKNQALTDAIYNAYIANSIATHAQEDAEGALSQANSNISSIQRIWYLKNSASVPSKPANHSEIVSTNTVNVWTTTKPSAENYRYYYYCDETCTGGGVYSYSDVMLDDVELSKYERGLIEAKVKNHWWDSEGAHIASGILYPGESEPRAITEHVPSTYGYHTVTKLSGLEVGYNNAKVIELNSSTPALKFYQPPTISGSTVVEGNPTMELSGSTLTFYNPNDGVTTAATLSSTGLNIVDGSISLGATGSDRVHLSTKDLSSAIEINGQSTTEWRLLLGDKFGVTKAGYMNAGSGKIGGWSIGTDTNKSLYYSNSTPGASTNNLVLSPSSAKNTNAIGGSAVNLTWFISAGQAFGVTTAGKLYATGVNISGEIIADSGKIGGLILEESSIHSNEKTLNNNVAGIYIDGLGQFNTGDGVNYIKSWKDSSDNKWKISLRASEMLFSSGANVEDELITAKSDAETAKASIDKEINGYLSIVVESSIYEESAIEIDAEKYGSSFGAGTNTFTYTNNHWYLNGSLVTEEDFSNYGMTIKQTPVEGDSFNVISTNVEGLSSSLTNLREEVNSNSDSISNLITYTESNTSNISALSEESSATTETVDDLTTQVQELSDALYGEKTEREARMTFGTDSAGDPILTLGGGAHSDFQMNLTNLELAFKEKNYTVASISGHVLTIENANVSSQLQMGNFAWIPRKNGHLTLKYIG